MYPKQDGWTALIAAADCGATDCVRLLLDAEANREAKDGVCLALPMSFVISFFLYCGVWFLARSIYCLISVSACRAYLCHASQNGWTALIWAARNGHADCLRLLLGAGANKDAKTMVRIGPFLCISSSHLYEIIFSPFVMICVGLLTFLVA
jgi:hypothetical protein